MVLYFHILKKNARTFISFSAFVTFTFVCIAFFLRRAAFLKLLLGVANKHSLNDTSAVGREPSQSKRKVTVRILGQNLSVLHFIILFCWLTWILTQQQIVNV
jgi:hypothetical protein